MIHTARQNPKFIRLVRRIRPLLGTQPLVDADSVATAVLERIWHATATGAIRGDIGRYDNEVIAEMAGWLGDADELVAMLVDCGWLDECPEHRLLVHDWADHAPRHVKGNVTKRGGFIECSQGSGPKASPQGPAQSGDLGVKDEPQGRGAPNLTKPNLTKELPSEACPETAEPSSEPPPERAVLAFPCDGAVKVFAVYQSLIDDYQADYPALDVLGEFRTALRWIKDNPKRRKTHSGMRRFLGNWLSKSQNSTRGSPLGKADQNLAVATEYLERKAANAHC